MIRSLPVLLSWILRAWPALALAPIALVHALAHQLFPNDTILVNKIIGTMLQATGGLIVLYSINKNLGLFRDQHLGSVIISWFRSFPFFRKSVTISVSDSVHIVASESARICVHRITNNVEEKIAELERQLEELRQYVNENVQAANVRTAQVHSELSTTVAINAAAVNQLSSRLELATVGGFKEQTFGVLLALYGAVSSVFT